MGNLLYKLYRVNSPRIGGFPVTIEYLYFTKSLSIIFSNDVSMYRRNDLGWYSCICSYFNGDEDFYSFTEYEIETLLTHRNPEYRNWAKKKLEKRNGKSSL